MPGARVVQCCAMGLHLIAINHAEHGLGAVESATPAVAGLGRRVVERAPAARGAIVLATCNRVEVYVDADAPTSVVAAQVRAVLAEAVGADLPARVVADAEALTHLFDVGAGLDSMVVGEREIAGQLRRALKVAHREHTSTGLLTEAVEQALRTARRVAASTRLGAAGRSVVSVALDLLRLEWPSTRVLLLGTGAYAGAVVADLQGRGCCGIAVASATGRAASFAASHPGVAVASGGLEHSLAEADLVVTCRGTGGVVTAAHVEAAVAARGGRELAIVDLAVSRDVEPAAAGVAGVVLLDLPVIARHVPDAAQHDLKLARELVAEGVSELVTRFKGREMDPAVVALRDTVYDMVADEVERLPQGRPVTREEAAHALRRLAARLVHVPSVRARKAAEEGRTDEYLTALSELWGIESRPRTVLDNLEIDLRPGGVDVAVPPETLEEDSCPVTGLTLDDLGRRRRLEAM